MCNKLRCLDLVSTMGMPSESLKRELPVPVTPHSLSCAAARDRWCFHTSVEVASQTCCIACPFQVWPYSRRSRSAGTSLKYLSPLRRAQPEKRARVCVLAEHCLCDARGRRELFIDSLETLTAGSLHELIAGSNRCRGFRRYRPSCNLLTMLAFPESIAVVG